MRLSEYEANPVVGGKDLHVLELLHDPCFQFGSFLVANDHD